MAESLFGKVKNYLLDLREEGEMTPEDIGYEDDYDEPSSSGKSYAKVVNIRPGLNAQMKVSIFEPEQYEECTVIADALKSHKIVMVNLEKVKDVHENDRIRCFLNGINYALDGSASTISHHIMVLAPSNVEIDGNMKKELESKKSFSW